MSLYADRTTKLDTENAFKFGQHIAKAMLKGRDVIPLNLGQPDFAIPEWVTEEVKRQLDLHNTGYCDPQGILSLRVAIADRIQKTRKLAVSPDQIVVFPGAKPAIGFTQQVYCNPGDEVIYPSPGYPIFESFVRYVDAVPVPLFLDEAQGFAFDPDQLAEKITSKTKVIFLNFPANPTGGIMTYTQLEKVAEVILRRCSKEVRVYSDEIYEDIIFDDHPHFSIASVPGMERITIVSSGFSKGFSWTGGRVGYAIFPTVEEALVFKNMNINYFSCLSPYNEEGARAGLIHPETPNYLKKVTRSFQERRDLVLAELKKIPGVHCLVPPGTFYVFPNVAVALDSLGVMAAHQRLPKDRQQSDAPTKLFQLFALYEHGVAVMDRESFGRIGARHQHFIRLSSATSPENLQAGTARLQAAFADTEGFERFFQQYENFNRAG